LQQKAQPRLLRTIALVTFLLARRRFSPTRNNPKSKNVAARVRIMGWDFSKTYFPQEILAPSLAILCHHHTIQILSEFRQKQIEPNERSLGRSGCKQPTIYDFKVVILTFLDFKIFQNPNF
jgi:hypothetical protein